MFFRSFITDYLVPIIEMIKAETAQAAITPVMGNAVPLFRMLTSAEVKA